VTTNNTGTDPTVTVVLGDGTEATWFPGSEVEAIAELIEDHLGAPDSRTDLSGPDTDTPMIVAWFEDGSFFTWLPGDEVDAIAELIETRFGVPDSMRC
jgi:hypothetical protein